MSYYSVNHDEHENSSHSLPSRRDSEMGSSFLVESGIYVTSFAASIFIAALVTFGALVFTLVIALAFMLESCHTKTNGNIELGMATKEHDYCRSLASNAELNGFQINELLADCKDYVVHYIKKDRYHHELNMSIQVVDNYLSTLVPNKDGLDVILMDIDGILFSSPSNYHDQTRFRLYLQSLDLRNNKIEKARDLANLLNLELYSKLRAGGWLLVLVTRRHEMQRNSTVDALISAGFSGWSSLVMRSDHEMPMESWEYILRRKEELRNQGFHIVSVISNQWDALTGPRYEAHNFKLPNPIYLQVIEKQLHLKNAQG
ncbi:uncharacterized protein At2g39920 [Amborella trichopoda]|uniref:Acid phosphatase n=1 Tax=Amborella trichopoda TaxID=13333 RepID=W1PPP2_AMBTC|nr:uncharacterized protein At2g39920 [Amborella trichopoda]XP_020525133.1 uncharacterized protein At2g39920 [Amborella trichopoda]XP_020525134.1 uncharacterized protein At2g39920 [Amborella trichopoda]XP_020525135.1 uncharacterized protein At2g39920 [Amborella trichopoda]ERN09666.1 hypothetical protein AMTR_s00029p00206560 [Amborella trichopoda]|eukprot:XP_006848085.1 uncharacterized protein At2g39920 [Amborella trichopoda]